MTYSTQFINDNFDEFYELDQEQFPDDSYEDAVVEEFGIKYYYADDEHAPYLVYEEVEYQFISDIADDNFEVKEFLFKKIIETNKNIQEIVKAKLG
jgi:hypothetical protein